MHGQRFCIAFVLASALCAANATGALAGPYLTTIGPPFATGALPSSVAFGPDDPGDGLSLLATANALDDSVSVFEVSAAGTLRPFDSPAPTGGSPVSVAFSPAGRLFATANFASDSVSMFSAANGDVNPVGQPATTGEGPSSVAFSSDGGLLATANGAAGSISVFEVSEVGDLDAAGAPVVTAEPPSLVTFSPRDRLLVTTSRESGSVSVFSVTTTGALTAVGSAVTPGVPNSAAFSPDGRLLAIASQPHDYTLPGLVSLFSVSADGGLTPIGAPTPTDIKPDAVAFGRDGELLAITDAFAGKVAMYSVSGAGALAPIGEPAQTMGSGPGSVAFSPSGRHLATANSDDDSVSMFSVSAAGLLIPVGAPALTGSGACGVQFSPGGGLLATANGGSEGSPGGSISMFSLSADGHQTALGSPTSVDGGTCSLAFSPDGNLLATANGPLDEVSVFSVAADGVLTALGSTALGGAAGGYAYAVAFSPDGNLLAVTRGIEAGGSVSTFAVATDGALTAVDSSSTGPEPWSVAFRPDGGTLAVAGQSGISVFSVSTGGALSPVGAPTPTGDSPPASLAFSPNGQLLAATTLGTNTVSVFSVSDAGALTPVEPATALDSFSSSVAFSPSGELLAATSERALWLFSVSEAGVLTAVGSPTPVNEPLSAVAFSPDGTLLVEASGSTLSVHPLAAPMLDVAVTSAPPAMTSSTTAAFEFEASYPSMLECRLDAASFAPCATPESHAFAGLGEGSHTFAVRATDLLGNVEPSPASHSWIVDLTAPLEAALAQPASGAAHLPAAPLFSWSPTTDNLTGVDRYELWVDAVLSGTVPAVSCGASCSATPEPLADGAHSWQVRAVDGVGNVAVSGSRPFSVDAAPPQAFALISPADDAATTSRRPALSWQAAVDAGIGLGSYDVVLDDQVAASGLGAGATSFTPAGDLAEGVHRWHVVARDAYGNERESATWRFTVDATAPVAAVTAAPNPALAGRNITFDAGGSSDSGSGIARVEWDLDGDGTFETDTGAGRTATRSFTEPGTYAVLVRVSDRVGLSATARVDQRVTAAGQTGPLGVSINKGVRYTRSPKVTITATWPLFASQMLVSNDGGFAAAAVLPLSKETPWTLDSSGAERSSRLVYVRFRRGLTTSETYIDDIILDESRPSVTAARVALTRRAAAPRLTIRARDRGLAGVASVQVTNNRRRPLAKYRRYHAKLTLVRQPGYRRLNARKPLYVRVRDRAGNVSAWRTVKRAR